MRNQMQACQRRFKGKQHVKRGWGREGVRSEARAQQRLAPGGRSPHNPEKLPAATSKERRNIKVVVAFVKHRFRQARTNGADANWTLLAFGRAIAVAIFDR